eukprot:1146328-Pelagomonas_calceolata.AAC.4
MHKLFGRHRSQAAGAIGPDPRWKSAVSFFGKPRAQSYRLRALIVSLFFRAPVNAGYGPAWQQEWRRVV